MNRLWNISRMEPFQGPPKWIPTLGELQKTLQKGEYMPLRPLPMFESNFVQVPSSLRPGRGARAPGLGDWSPTRQLGGSGGGGLRLGVPEECRRKEWSQPLSLDPQVTSQGAPVYVHHRTNRLTMGVAASLPGLVLPDLLLIAQPPEGRECSNLVLTRYHILPSPATPPPSPALPPLSAASPRMIPLDLARLYIHDLPTWRLKLRLVTGRYYYLELNAPDKEVGFLFDRWMRLIHLLQEPATTWAPRSLPPMDLAHAAPPASTWRLQDQSRSRRSVMIVEPTFPYKTLTSQKQRKAKAQGLVTGGGQEKDGDPGTDAAKVPHYCPYRSQLDLCRDRAQTEIQTPEALALPLRAQTAFSPPREAQHHHPDHLQHYFQPHAGCLSAAEAAVVLGGLVESPSHCVSEDSPDSPLVGSHDHLDVLWQQDIDALMDPESSTLSSSSLCPATYPPTFYLSAPYSSFPRHNEKARPPGNVQRLGPPPSQKTPSVPATSWKAPFILDRSQKVSAVRAPSQKISTVPGPSQKGPAVPPAPRKTPAVPAVLKKAPAVPAAPKKAPAIPAPSQKAPPAFAVPPKAVSLLVPNRKPQFQPTPPQKALTPPSQHPTPLDPADRGMLPMGTDGGHVLERRKPEGKPEPVVLVDTQETNIVELKTQKTSLELPFATTKKESEEVLISKAQEITLDGLKGKGTLEGQVRRRKEEISLDMPGLKAKEVGQQKKWVKTKEVAIKGAPQEHSRPFPVEGLALAQLMILASSKERPLTPAAVGLPSWLPTPQVSAVSAMGTAPLSHSHVSLLAGTPVAVRERPQSGAWAKGSTRLPVEETAPWAKGSAPPGAKGSAPPGVKGSAPPGAKGSAPPGAKGSAHPWVEAEAQPQELPQDPRGPSKVPPRSKRAPSSPKIDSAFLAPIPLPASRWEDIPQSPISLSPISKMEARVSQEPKRVSQEPARMLYQCPVATTALSSEILLPTLLKLENMRNVATKVEKIKEELGAFNPLHRYFG
ncbi:hypothetical protein HPG69_013836 [Diceros bicornis minor]|uniref:Golgi associated RAB2 interactor protein-like Rab2B-binding domain-containing protein n=1 Tax=Diceros bicornis minor TaxID=77932 RepID=A0A7J7EN87_DICBM|nr:hypothetical protein HPG69_013836 [Diceros bicornis minor]